MAPAFRKNDPDDIKISKLVGLETYKALYQLYPDLYHYISDPLVPTKYFLNLVLSVVATSGLTFNVAGTQIKNTLVSLVNDEPIEDKDSTLVAPLLDSSYPIEYLKSTFWEDFIWITLTVIISFLVIFVLYVIGFWNFLFNSVDGIACYGCSSIFDKIML